MEEAEVSDAFALESAVAVVAEVFEVEVFDVEDFEVALIVAAFVAEIVFAFEELVAALEVEVALAADFEAAEVPVPDEPLIICTLSS